MTDSAPPDLDANIERVEIDSPSNVSAVGYDETTRTLEIVFRSGGIYRYGSVDPEYAAPLLTAGPARETAAKEIGGWSAGRFVRSLFVTSPERFPVVKVGDMPRPLATFRAFRARWIDAAGQVVRDDTFEWDLMSHESAELVLPGSLIGLVIDAPYFDLPALQAHVDGYIEAAVVNADTCAIVNEEGLLRGMEIVPHPDVIAASASYGQWLVGPIVLVERIP